jgi:leucyl aminopeptidase
MYRNIHLVTLRGGAAVDAVAVFLLARDPKTPRARWQLPAGYRDLDASIGGALTAALRRRELGTGRGEVTTLYPAQGSARVYLVGLGPSESFTADVLRIAAAKLIRAAGAARAGSLRILFLPALADAGQHDPDRLGAALGDGLVLGNLEFSEYHGTGKPAPDAGDAALDAKVEVEPALHDGAERALQVGASVNLARTLAVRPPNLANPRYLVEYCRKMARQSGLTCTVIDARRAARLKMGGLLAVGAAGSAPPALIRLEWRGGRGAAAQQKSAGPIVLVGKAVTFDTGGYSLKPNDSMVSMKYDKSGGAAVIGALHAVARMKLPLHVVGLIPTVENMIASASYRPDDILTLGNGVTVEVTNTDAEGRLILADALAYGCRELRPQAVIDLATLTGGIVVALGSHGAGLFCDREDLRQRLLAAAEFTGERLWPMPLWDEHREQLKGTHGDIINSGGREGSPCQGAAFLSYFAGQGGKPRKNGSAEDPAWAHLDIAGVSDLAKDSPLYRAGATGFGVRLLVHLLEGWKPLNNTAAPKRRGAR